MTDLMQINELIEEEKKKICRYLLKVWQKANLDEQLQKGFEDFLIYNEVWIPHPPSVAEHLAKSEWLKKAMDDLIKEIK